MQWLTAILIWLVLLGGTALYFGVRGAPPDIDLRELTEAGGRFELALTPTYDSGGADPFALDTATQQAVRVRISGIDEPAGEAARLERGLELRFPLAGFVLGSNEVLVHAAPPADGGPGAVRAVLLRDGQPLLERVLWSDNGRPISEALRVQVGGGAER